MQTPSYLFQERGIEALLPESWVNVAKSEEDPLALTDPEEGVGGLQLTVAEYDDEMEQDLTTEDLKEMLSEFSVSHKMSPLSNPEVLPSQHPGTHIVCAAFRFMNTEFLRVFYIARQKQFVFATYTCSFEEKDEEFATCESIIKSLRFIENNQPSLQQQPRR